MDWDKIWDYVGVGFIIGCALFVGILTTKALVPSQLAGFTIYASTVNDIPIYRVYKVIKQWPDEKIYTTTNFDEALTMTRKLNEEAGTRMVEY